ncbi:MAG TPA: trypsin-like peptidase domain-containing protein [Steroidobacteraceae bacterium]|nr:trypsin-like peptidase domain-containing protein [Steroidobacteraceae bacterium]
MPALKNLLVFLLRFTVLGLALAFVVLLFRPDLMRARSLDRAAAAATPPGPASYASAVARSAPAVVNIYTARRVLDQTPRSPIESYMGGDWPLYRERIERSLGSGVIIDASGRIVTNDHVVPDGAAIMVELSDGRIAQARVSGRDRDTDLAVLQIDLDDLPTIRLGRSDTLRVGDVVLAIGNPVGLSQTVTQGIVSATGRGLRLNAFEDFIQTDAAINVGNSGGALVNVEGELVGINTAVFSRTAGIEGIGFAIPVNLVRGVTEEIVQNGRVIRGWLGVLPEDLPASQARALGLAPGTGVLVLNLYSDSPAHRAGLKPGDVLTHIGESQLTGGPQALATVATMAPGQVVELRGLRAGRPFRMSATIEERPR